MNLVHLSIIDVRTCSALGKQFCQINKNILLVFMPKISFVVPTKHFAISFKFWILKQNVLSGQQKKFCCINFFLSVTLHSILSEFTLIIVIGESDWWTLLDLSICSLNPNKWPVESAFLKYISRLQKILLRAVLLLATMWISIPLFIKTFCKYRWISSIS